MQKLLFSASRDATIRIWNASNALVQTITMPSSVFALAWNTTALVAGIKGGIHVFVSLGTYDSANGCPRFAPEPLRAMHHEAFVGCVTLLDSRIYAAGMDGMLAAYDLLISRGVPRLKSDFKRRAHDTGRAAMGRR